MDTISDNTTGGNPARQRICAGCLRLAEVADENERLRDTLATIAGSEPQNFDAPMLRALALSALGQHLDAK